MRDVTGKVIIEHGQPVTENRIIYQFVDQAFLQAYIKAWKFYAEAEDRVDPKKQFLIIEEINRGNCAQIFGDLFQLLDRNDSGFSEYFIHADKDMQKHLSNAFKGCFLKDSHKDTITSLYPKEDDVVAKVLSGEILLLPNNLYIWATMNTSDQSLFPIDSAFKRRWDWEYEPIKYKNINWVIDIEGSKYLWTSFQREINKRIFDATNSEDKMLGDYFVNPADGVITEKILLNKILFYLWNDVCKDGEGDIFKTADNEDVTFSDLHSDGGKDKLIAMMKYLKVEET
jgi:5-methylcytosine-specific restriction endonuclease McrBC GTP-binding regulatory subunit McrB